MLERVLLRLQYKAWQSTEWRIPIISGCFQINANQIYTENVIQVIRGDANWYNEDHIGETGKQFGKRMTLQYSIDQRWISKVAAVAHINDFANKSWYKIQSDFFLHIFCKMAAVPKKKGKWKLTYWLTYWLTTDSLSLNWILQIWSNDSTQIKSINPSK